VISDAKHVEGVKLGATLITSHGLTPPHLTASGKRSALLKADMESLFCVAFSPDGKTLATGHHDGKARLWDVETGKVRQTFAGHRTDEIMLIGVESLAFSPNGKLLATGGRDYRILLSATQPAAERPTGAPAGR